MSTLDDVFYSNKYKCGDGYGDGSFQNNSFAFIYSICSPDISSVPSCYTGKFNL